MTAFIRTSYLIAALAFASTASAQGVILTVENVRSDRGTVIVLAFDKERHFNTLNYMRAVDYADVPARTGRMTVRLPRLTEGPYAIFLFHDENGDQDLNFQGETLLEGAGATGAPNPDDMPSFKEASVFPGDVTVIMHYSD
ncbi:MAG: DUF2141 domain-containing protein [Mangrovicoccus sp.]